MSIKETLEKIKPFYGLLVIIIFSSIFFVLGRISVENSQKTPINISYSNPGLVASAINSSTTIISAPSETLVIPTDGPVIGSKSGKKYYFPWCGTVKRIKPENQVRFGSISEAKASGFTPGGKL